MNTDGLSLARLGSGSRFGEEMKRRDFRILSVSIRVHPWLHFLVVIVSAQFGFSAQLRTSPELFIAWPVLESARPRPAPALRP